MPRIHRTIIMIPTMVALWTTSTLLPSVGAQTLQRPRSQNPSGSVPSSPQNRAPQNSGTHTQTSLKPTVTSGANAPFRGMTEIEAAPGLDRILRGGEPRGVEELKLLQAQQSKIAELVRNVTVNVQQGSSQGSGVIITPDGYVLTAAHVAGKPNRHATLVMSDGKRVNAKTLGMNRFMDAGLMKITDARSEPWPHATLGISAELKPGHWVVATGHPGGYMPERPVVVRVGRILENLQSTLVTDCPLIGGDSGGPLFDMRGKLIGIHSRIGNDISDNMHVPVDVFSESWEKMVQGVAWGTLPGYKPVIGVLGSNDETKAVIAKLIDDSPAIEAGLQVGDTIRKFDGVAINTFKELIQAVESSLPGDRVPIEVERRGEIKRMHITIGVQEN